MSDSALHVMTVEGEVCAPVASARLVRFDFPEPIDNLMQEADSYRVDLCLTPRPTNARGCYPQRWGRHRFERLGELFMVPPGESMQALSDGCCQQASIICEFDPVQMNEWLDCEPRWSDRDLRAGLDVRAATIRGLLLRLAEEARNPGLASATLVELITAQVAIELARFCHSFREDDSGGGLADWRLKQIEERLRDDHQPPSLQELAQLCGLSVRQLTRGFRISRGCSIGDYIESRRLEQARQLLAGDSSIKAVAYTLGFSSPSSFSCAFRRMTGETPSQYRQRRRAH